MQMRGRRWRELETRKEVGERRMHERMGEMKIKDKGRKCKGQVTKHQARRQRRGDAARSRVQVVRDKG